MTDKQAQIDTMLNELERLTQRITELQAEHESAPIENLERTEELRRLRRERAELHRMTTNLQIAKLGGIPGSAPK